ncbi:LysM peptidoglycan-binding domain-containing protein [candidate division KSB1 bacterium]|nr:LysM peptidoglycan-binding domain-containing protein [bacterium]NUM65906.1 LysM peptidoglycan-binding domain-containing protein [candidate division KSB1 bacterium]
MKSFYKVRFAAYATLICSLLFGFAESSGQPRARMRGVHPNLRMHAPLLVRDNLLQGTRSSTFLAQSQFKQQSSRSPRALLVNDFVQRFNENPAKRDYFFGITPGDRFNKVFATFGMHEQPTLNKASVVHVVNAGETISEIIKEHYGHVDNALVNKIALYNDIPNPNNITVGQRILLPNDIRAHTPVFPEDLNRALYRSKFLTQIGSRDEQRFSRAVDAADVFAESDNARIAIFKRRPADDDDLLVFDDKGESSSINSKEELDEVLGKYAIKFPRLHLAQLRQSIQRSKQGAVIVQSDKTTVNSSSDRLKRLGLDVIGDDGAKNPTTATPSPDVIIVNRYLEEGFPDAEVWNHLSNNTGILGFERLSDTKNVIFEKADNGYTMYSVDRETGPRVSKLNSLAEFYSIVREEIITKASTDQFTFLHAAVDGEQVVMQNGKKSARLFLKDIASVLENPAYPLRQLDELFESSPNEIAVYVDPLERNPQAKSQALPNADVCDPIRILAMLSARYPNKIFYLCHETDLARANHVSIKMLQSTADLGALVPDESFRIEDHGLINQIKKQLLRSGIKLIESSVDATGIPNFVLISGHNSPSLVVDYLNQLGKNGILKDRIVFLHTCYANANPALLHRLIQLYQAKAIYLHTEPIRPVAIENIIPHLNKILMSNRDIHPAELVRRAVNSALQDSGLSPTLKDEISKLKKGGLLISLLLDSSKSNMKTMEYYHG